MSKKWSKYELDFLLSNYKNMKSKEMSVILNRSKESVSLKINRLGLKVSNYYFDKKFFSTIDNEEKAYWLGFFYADGYVYKNNNNRVYYASLEISNKDIKHLYKFRDSINGNIKIKQYDKSRNENVSKMCSICCHSIDMADDLIRMGCVQNKSFCITFPDIDFNLYRHFIRGFFDGDGSIFFRKNSKYADCNITSASESILLSIKEILSSFSINSTIYKYEGRPYQLYIRENKSVDYFLNYIYKDSEIYLDRKFLLYLKNCHLLSEGSSKIGRKCVEAETPTPAEV